MLGESFRLSWNWIFFIFRKLNLFSGDSHSHNIDHLLSSKKRILCGESCSYPLIWHFIVLISQTVLIFEPSIHPFIESLGRNFRFFAGKNTIHAENILCLWYCRYWYYKFPPCEFYIPIPTNLFRISSYIIPNIVLLFLLMISPPTPLKRPIQTNALLLISFAP